MERWIFVIMLVFLARVVLNILKWLRGSINLVDFL
jgi:hypothetical protein